MRSYIVASKTATTADAYGNENANDNENKKQSGFEILLSLNSHITERRTRTRTRTKVLLHCMLRVARRILPIPNLPFHTTPRHITPRASQSTMRTTGIRTCTFLTDNGYDRNKEQTGHCGDWEDTATTAGNTKLVVTSEVI